MTDDRQTEKEARARKALRGVPWATGLVQETANPGELFELRFAYELHRAGLTPTRPFKAGVDGTDIDFQVRGGAPGFLPWNIELVCINESDAIGDAREEVDVSGVKVSSLDLGERFPGDLDRIKKKQTPEHDMMRFVSKLGAKIWDGKRPIKFSVPDGSAVNMLLVDARAYLGGLHSIDAADCCQILYGPKGLPPEYVQWDPQTKTRIRGLWDRANESAASRTARERLQVVGFVHEEEFEDDEIVQVTRLFANPSLQVDLTQNPLGWTVDRTPRVGLRRTNALWNLG